MTGVCLNCQSGPQPKTPHSIVEHGQCIPNSEFVLNGVPFGATVPQVYAILGTPLERVREEVSDWEDNDIGRYRYSMRLTYDGFFADYEDKDMWSIHTDVTGVMTASGVQVGMTRNEVMALLDVKYYYTHRRYFQFINCDASRMNVKLWLTFSEHEILEGIAMTRPYTCIPLSEQSIGGVTDSMTFKEVLHAKGEPVKVARDIELATDPIITLYYEDIRVTYVEPQENSKGVVRYVFTDSPNLSTSNGLSPGMKKSEVMEVLGVRGKDRNGYFFQYFSCKKRENSMLVLTFDDNDILTSVGVGQPGFVDFDIYKGYMKQSLPYYYQKEYWEEMKKANEEEARQRKESGK